MPVKNKRRFYKRKAAPAKSLATKSYVQKIVRKEQETKYHDLSLASQPYLVAMASTTIVDLCAISQGTQDIQRIGDKIRLRSLDMRVQILCADSTNVVRFIIFQWHPNTTITATDPQGSQIIADTATYPFLSNYVHDYQNQFIVVYDKVWGSELTSDSANRVMHIRPSLKYVRKQVNYTGATTSGSDKLYLLMVSDSGSATHPSVKVQARIRYDDA